MKFFGKLIKRKELTVVVKEIFNTHNIFFKPVFIKGCFTINFYVAVVPNYFVVGRCIFLNGLFCALPMFQDFTIEAREVVKLQRINMVVAVCQKRQSSIIFQRDLRDDLSGCVSPGLQTRYLSNLKSFIHNVKVGHLESVMFSLTNYS